MTRLRITTARRGSPAAIGVSVRDARAGGTHASFPAGRKVAIHTAPAPCRLVLPPTYNTIDSLSERPVSSDTGSDGKGEL